MPGCCGRGAHPRPIWSLHNRFVRLIEHLLKWEYQPERRGSSWTRTIVVQRIGIARLLAANPSFPGQPG